MPQRSNHKKADQHKKRPDQNPNADRKDRTNQYSPQVNDSPGGTLKEDRNAGIMPETFTDEHTDEKHDAARKGAHKSGSSTGNRSF